MTDLDNSVELIVDSVTRRPACVLIQAVYGCAWSPLHRIATERWLVSPTPTMRRFTFSPGEFDRYVAMMGGR